MPYKFAYPRNDLPRVEGLTLPPLQEAVPGVPARNDLPTVEGLTLEQVFHPFVKCVVDPRSGDLILTPFEEQEAPEAGTEAPPVDWEALAIGLLVKNPGWTVQKVADYVGVHRGTLHRSHMFMAFRDRIRAAGKQDFLADLPRGTKEIDPDDKRAGARLEAWCERDDDE
jgi:hypothetical protein